MRQSKPAWLIALRFAVSLLGLPNGSADGAALEPSQVAVLVNKDTPISSQVGRMYEKLRGIPLPTSSVFHSAKIARSRPNSIGPRPLPPSRSTLKQILRSAAFSPLQEFHTPSRQPTARTKALLSITSWPWSCGNNRETGKEVSRTLFFLGA